MVRCGSRLPQSAQFHPFFSGVVEATVTCSPRQPLGYSSVGGEVLMSTLKSRSFTSLKRSPPIEEYPGLVVGREAL